MESYFSLNEAGINTKGKTTGQIKVNCPKCPPDRGNPKDTSLSVDLEKKVWNCHYCGWKGGVKDASYQKTKVYPKPAFNPSSPTDEMTDWFLNSRGIKRATLEKFIICPMEKFIQKTGRKAACTAFPYIKNGEVVNIKSRFEWQDSSGKHKTFSLEKDCELPFFNIDSLKGQDLCVIVEGEIDALTVYQETNLPVVSVPAGASKEDQKQKLECLNNDWEAFKDVATIVLATDNDGPGLALRNELARRLGKERCFYIQFPSDCKDINEVLVKHGSTAVVQAFSNYQPFPIEGIITVADMEDEIDDLYLNGYPKGVTIGFPEFDKLLSFRGGEVTTITGIPGHGKSEWLDETLGRLSGRHGWKHAIYSAENQPVKLHFAKLAERFIGLKFHDQDSRNQMSPEQAGRAKAFINEHFFFINDREVSTTIDGLIEKATELVRRKGIKTFTIDPYNCIEHQRPVNMSETEYVSLLYSKWIFRSIVPHDSAA